MTKNEIIEAINSTIMPNGQKGITAEALANILIEMTNASGGGGGGVTFYIGNVDSSTETPIITVTEEQKAHNAEMFQVVKNAEHLPSVVVDFSEYYSSMTGLPYRLSEPSTMIAYISPEAAAAMGAPNEGIGLSAGGCDLLVNPDGSITAMPVE